MEYHNPTQIIKRVSKAFGVKDVRSDENHRIVVTFYDNADVQYKEDVKDHMEKVGYQVHESFKHKIKFSNT